MSRDFMEDYLQHSWGKKPEQKAREKQYNKEYYQKHKDKWKNLNDKHWKDAAESEAKAAKERSRYWTNAANDAERSGPTQKSTSSKDYNEMAKTLQSLSDRVLSDYESKIYKDAAKGYRAKAVATGQAENERAKAVSNYRKNAKDAKTKSDVYESNIQKEIKKRNKKRKRAETIQRGKNWVKGFLDGLFS